MIGGIVDTTVVVHYFRRDGNARRWVDTQRSQLAVTSITWLEVMQGAASKSSQQEIKRVLSQFDLLYITVNDQQWAMQQIERLQFSHHIGMNDCLIASVAQRLQIALYTHNLKDMTPMIGALAVRPYP